MRIFNCCINIYIWQFNDLTKTNNYPNKHFIAIFFFTIKEQHYLAMKKLNFNIKKTKTKCLLVK